MLRNIINSVLKQRKQIKITDLPSQAFFYKKDFEVYVERASMDTIVGYQYHYNKENVTNIINSIKSVVKSHTHYSKNYSFDDVKSIDIIYLFLEIVKWTNKKDIEIPYMDDKSGRESLIKFSNETFNYFPFDIDMIKYYDEDTAEFFIDGYRFSIPCIGIEDSLTDYLLSKTDTIYNSYSYDFMYFLSGKKRISEKEIDNLIHIFNFDLDDDEKDKINNIVDKFKGLMNYSLRKGDKVIDINAKLDLSTVWN